jgi:hypothetical protein
LREHEEPELRTGERSLLAEDDPIPIFFEGYSPVLVDRKVPAASIFHRSPFRIEARCRLLRKVLGPNVNYDSRANLETVLYGTVFRERTQTRNVRLFEQTRVIAPHKMCA